jgi:hypothetical protein
MKSNMKYNIKARYDLARKALSRFESCEYANKFAIDVDMMRDDLAIRDVFKSGELAEDERNEHAQALDDICMIIDGKLTDLTGGSGHNGVVFALYEYLEELTSKISELETRLAKYESLK